MEERYDCHTRVVHIDKNVKKGTVELPSEFFDFTGMDPGHHVVIDHEGKQYKVRSKLTDLLKRTEVGVGPDIATPLGLMEGQMVCVEDKSTFGDRMFDEVEELGERLEMRADQAKDFAVDVADRVEDEYRKVRVRIDPDSSEPKEKDYIEVAPDLDEVAASPPEEPVEDISEQVDVWTPDPDGDGTVPVFKPGKDEEEEDV
jgi:hypothetical protein